MQTEGDGRREEFGMLGTFHPYGSLRMGLPLVHWKDTWNLAWNDVLRYANRIGLRKQVRSLIFNREVEVGKMEVDRSDRVVSVVEAQINRTPAAYSKYIPAVESVLLLAQSTCTTMSSVFSKFQDMLLSIAQSRKGQCGSNSGAHSFALQSEWRTSKRSSFIPIYGAPQTRLCFFQSLF
jgi:hypothetical protein